MLDELMSKYGQTSRSALFALLIANDINRKTAGRPKANDNEPEADPDWSDDLPKKYTHFGRMIGRKELVWLDEQAKSIPQQRHG